MEYPTKSSNCAKIPISKENRQGGSWVAPPVTPGLGRVNRSE